MLGYTMTAGEELLQNEITDLVHKINDWGMFTTDETIRSNRDEINRLNDIAARQLEEPKKTYATTAFNAIRDNWRTWWAKGQAELKGPVLRGLNRVLQSLSMEPREIQTQVERLVETVVTKEVPVEKPEKKIFGIKALYVYLAGAVAVGAFVIPKLLKGKKR